MKLFFPWNQVTPIQNQEYQMHIIFHIPHYLLYYVSDNTCNSQLTCKRIIKPITLLRVSPGESPDPEAITWNILLSIYFMYRVSSYTIALILNCTRF